MANPNPQHNPTDGLGVAAVVQVSGTGITAEHTPATGAPNPGPYSLSLNVGGTPNPTTCQLTASLVDVNNTAYSPVGSFVYKSYNNFTATESAFAGYSGKIASVSGSGLITALSPGQAIIEVQFPTFDNTLGNDANTGNPDEMVYAQIIVQVGK